MQIVCGCILWWIKNVSRLQKISVYIKTSGSGKTNKRAVWPQVRTRHILSTDRLSYTSTCLCSAWSSVWNPALKISPNRISVMKPQQSQLLRTLQNDMHYWGCAKYFKCTVPVRILGSRVSEVRARSIPSLTHRWHNDFRYGSAGVKDPPKRPNGQLNGTWSTGQFYRTWRSDVV